MEDLIRLIRQTLDIKQPLEPTTPLLSSGIVDSLGVVVLLDSIETEYAVLLDETELGASTFDTPDQILAMIQRRSATSA